jgi:signal transduction histidine kinase
MERVEGPTGMPSLVRPRAARFLFRLHGTISSRAALLAVAVGAAVLVGWGLDVVVSLNVHRSLPPVRPNLAAAFVLAGLALWARRRSRRFRLLSVASEVCAGIVVMLGTATLMEYLLGHSLGVDELLIAGKGHGESLRMALPAAFATTLVGLAILLLDVRSSGGHRPAQWLGLLVLGTVAISALGYLLGLGALSSWSSSAPVALHALVVFCFLGLALLAEHPGEGLLRALAPDLDRELARVTVADRMAGFSVLGAAVASEVNNALMVVIGNLDLALRDLDLVRHEPDGPRLGALHQDVTSALAGAERVRRVVRNLRMLSCRDEHDEPTAVDVSAALEAALELASDEIEHRTRVVKQLQPGLRVTTTASRLHQLFLNLLVNGAEAMEQGRKEDNELRARTFSDERGRATIEIADTGRGMPVAVREHLLQPLVACKHERWTLGLGLTICQTIVVSLSGQIEVDTRLGRGTVVRIRLPATCDRVLATSSRTTRGGERQ